MPNVSKGPRLWKRPAERGRQALWVVKDQGKRISTGCFAKPFEVRPPEAAEQFLADYIAAKYAPERRLKDVDRIFLADVLLIYHADRRDQFEDKVQQRRFDASISRLNEYFGNRKLSEISQALTDGYVKHRGSPGGARRDLENLRAAINHHAKQNLHRAVITVTLPPKGQARDRWLERNEAAQLLWAAWRHQEVQTIHRGKNKGLKIKTAKHTLRHLARFILIGLYTGTRAAAIAAASPKREQGRAYVDLRTGIYYRLARGKRATNKRQPPAPVPERLLAHMRRWVVWVVYASRRLRDRKKFFSSLSGPLNSAAWSLPTFSIHRDDSALLRDWGKSRVPVYFDFRETEQGESPVWRLYPLSGGMLAYLTPVVRADFVKAHRDGENIEEMFDHVFARDRKIASARAASGLPLPGFPRHPTRRMRRL